MGSRGSTQQSLPGWALDTAKSILGTGTSLVAPGSTLPRPQDILGLQQMPPGLFAQLAPFNPTQQQGMDYLTGSAAPSAQLAGTGAGQVASTLQGDYLNSNPYLDAAYQQASRGLVNQYQTAIAPSTIANAQKAGVGGGSAQYEQQLNDQFGLGTNLSDLAAQIYGGNYQAERGRQVEAAQMIPGLQGALAAPGQQLLGVGTLQQGQQQSALDIATQNAQLQQEFPYKTLGYLANLLGSATGGGGQVTATTSK